MRAMLVAAVGAAIPLRSLYTLGYHSAKASDNKYRRLRVEMKDRRLRVRHRSGYLAAPPSGH